MNLSAMMCQASTRLALAFLAFVLMPPALAVDECARLFGTPGPAARMHAITPGEATAVNGQLKKNNRANRHVHSVAIVRHESTSEVSYTVLNGDAAPIYKGSQIHEAAEAIDDASTVFGADSVFISLAGFSPTKAAGMRSTMTMQWAHMGAKPTLLMREAHGKQAWSDLVLPHQFYVPHDKISKVRKISAPRRIAGAGSHGWYEVVIEFVVRINSVLKTFSVSVMVRTQDIQRQLEKVMIKLHPDWIASHASAAEVVGQVMAQMKDINPKMRDEDFKIEILDQVDGNRFVEEDATAGERDVRHG